MSSVDVLTTSPPLNIRDRSSPVIVVDSSDDEEGPTTKRRRTSYDDSAEGSENVIDLTEGDDANADHIRFRILPKLIKLPPFRFSEDNEEHDGIPLASLREHLQRLFGTNIQETPEQSPSPINPDELEITGAKESSSSSSSSSSNTTSSCSSHDHRHSRKNPPNTTASNNNNNNNTKEKDGNDGKVALECAICLGEMKNITATTCGHIFCKDCIRQAIQVTKCCPLCKKKLTLRSIHPIYI